MSEDKRKVSTDALETLGMKIDHTQKRDAIHLAVEPVMAKNILQPGDHVSACGRHTYRGSDVAVGIVDPFLERAVHPGEWFWLVIYPRHIHSLRHVWTHPSFPDEIKEESEIEKSKKWMENFGKNIQWIKDNENIMQIGIDYETIMRLANKWSENENNQFESGSFSTIYNDVDTQSIHSEFSDGEIKEFWLHYEIITGMKVEENLKRDFFGCCC